MEIKELFKQHKASKKLLITGSSIWDKPYILEFLPFKPNRDSIVFWIYDVQHYLNPASPRVLIELYKYGVRYACSGSDELSISGKFDLKPFTIIGEFNGETYEQDFQQWREQNNIGKNI